MFNIIYAQSGGMTPVINNSAASLIRTAQKHSDKINKIYAAKNGIIGLIEKRIVDVTELSEKEKRLAKDYQLQRAIDLLKGLSIFEESFEE
mgnify:CR=1 FL=1